MYIATPVLATALILAAPATADQLTTAYMLAALAIGLPLVALVAVFMPLAGLVSMYKNYQQAKTAGLVAVRRVLWWMLVSQAAGGVLAAIVIPLLHMLAVPRAWTTTASGLLSASGLLLPLAYAIGAWNLRVLDVTVSP